MDSSHVSINQNNLNGHWPWNPKSTSISKHSQKVWLPWGTKGNVIHWTSQTLGEHENHNEIQTTIQTVQKRLTHSIRSPENKTLRTEVHAIRRCWFSPKRSVPKSFEHDLCGFTVVPNDPWSRVWSHYPGNLQRSQMIEGSPNTPVSQPLRTKNQSTSQAKPLDWHS